MHYKPIENKRKNFLEKRPELSELTFDEMSYLIKTVSVKCIDNFSTKELMKIARNEAHVYI